MILLLPNRKLPSSHQDCFGAMTCKASIDISGHLSGFSLPLYLAIF